jgi:hemolysin activation/secretion protein
MRTNPPVPGFRFRATGLTTSISLLFATVPALAQTTPDAGSLQQQIERNRITRLPGPIAPEQPGPEAAARPAPGATVTVRRFEFAGNTLLDKEQLTAATRVYLDRPLDFNQLQGAAIAVAAAYREAGWIVRTFLPAQDVQDGKVTVQIVEATAGTVTLVGTSGERAPADRVKGIAEAQLGGEQRLSASALDRALLLSDDLPGVKVSGRLTEGKAPGQTDVVLTLGDEPLFAGQAGLDNQGSRATGPQRATFNGALNSPAGWGDQLSANAIHTEGSDYLRLGYTLPVGNDGWRVGVNTSALNYRLVASEFVSPVDLQGRGSTGSTGLEAIYPLLRSPQKNVFLQANYDNRRFDNALNGATTTNYQSKVVSLGVNANRYDSLGGGGMGSASLTFSSGELDLSGSPNQASVASTTQTDGNFSKWRYSVGRQQNLTRALSLSASLSGQAASKNLDSSENFYLGGPAGVRAYPSNEGGGADGNLVNLELTWQLPQGWNLSGFYDYGEIQVNHNNNYTGALAVNHYSLRGAGLGLAWKGPRGLALKATWAQRLGDNPNPTTTGNDQDGSLVKDRFWLEASLTF